MHYMTKPLSFRWPDEFVARIDEKRGSVSRSRFVRDAVDAYLRWEFSASPSRTAAQTMRSMQRGSPSPSLERAKRSIT